MLKLFKNAKDSAAKAARPLRAHGKTDRTTIGELEIEYWHAQSGEHTIVFVHGNSAGKEVFFKQFEALSSKGYSLLSIDLPGHGGSSDSKTPEQDYNFPAFAILLKKLLADLGIQNPLMVGWSLGGHVVIEMAGRGFHLAGAMIFGTPPVGPGMGADFQRAFLPTEAMAVTLNPSPSSDELNAYIKGLYGSYSPSDAFVRLAKRMDGAVRGHMGAHWATGDEGCHQRTVVAGWEKPLAVLHGDEDQFVNGQYLDALAWRNLWRGDVIHLPGVGHAPFIERPEEFNALLSDFAADVFAGANS